MIKISEYNKILNSVYTQGVLQCSAQTFEQSLKANGATPYVVDFCDMPLDSSITQAYYNEGLSVLAPIIGSKKKYDITQVSQAYVFYMGLLNREFVIGRDIAVKKSKDGTQTGKRKDETSIYTCSEALLEKLYKMGAFENEEKYKKDMKALFGEGSADFGNKKVTSFEKQSLPCIRLDIERVVGDSVSLKTTIPSFRSDYGVEFLIYPYTVFPYLSQMLVKFVENMKVKTFSEKSRKYQDIRGLTIIQKEDEEDVKTRRITFFGEDLERAYRRHTYHDVDEQEDALEMLKNRIRKTDCKWDCLKLYLKGFNLEASLYMPAYSGIRLERIVKILPCHLKDVDTSLYMIDFDNVRRLFRTRVNNWKLQHFKEFNKICNTDDCSNIDDRKQVLDTWVNKEDNDTLYRIIQMYPQLFSGVDSEGNVKSIEDGLYDMYRQKPNALKRLQYIELPDDMKARKDELTRLLKLGVCRIESISSRTGAPRMYLATNNEAVLKSSFFQNRWNAYESDKRTMNNIAGMIKDGRIDNYMAFVKKLKDGGIDGLVDYGSLDDSSDGSDWLRVLGEAYQVLMNDPKREEMRQSREETNPYLVNFRRVDAQSKDEFYGSVDVRNITNIEFGEQKIRK